MFEKINNCPICESSSFTNFIICEDHTVSRESFAIVQCNNCGLKFTNPRPSQELIGKYYESENYISHSNKGNNLVNIAYKFVRKITIQNKVNLIRGLKLENSVQLLDVGCGTGEFLAACIKKGWDCSGVEPSSGARTQSEKITKLDILEDLENVEGRFNVITLWHVLEHLPDLNKVMGKLSSHLKKNGKLIIAVPNSESYDAGIFKKYWAGYDVPRHFYHFSQESMKALLKRNKLKLSKVIPMKFDAYYVSLLSNRYKLNSPEYVNSIITGYKSNSYASKNNNNYSSLIYVISK